MIIFSGCNIFGLQKMNKEGIIFQLSYTNVSDSEYKVDASIINRSLQPFAIIYENKIFKNITRPSQSWFLDIKLDDSVNVEGEDELLFDSRIPTKDDYTVVSVGEKKDLSFIINFKKLIIRNPYNQSENIKAPKGKYSLQLIYFGYSKGHPLAIDSITSNKLFLNWKLE